jgi:hypothetical protein
VQCKSACIAVILDLVPFNSNRYFEHLMFQMEMKQPLVPLVSNPEVRQVIKQTLRKLDKDGIVYCKPITDFNHREYEVSTSLLCERSI